VKTVKKYITQIILAVIFVVVGILAVMSDSEPTGTKSKPPTDVKKPYSGVTF